MVFIMVFYHGLSEAFLKDLKHSLCRWCPFIMVSSSARLTLTFIMVFYHGFYHGFLSLFFIPVPLPEGRAVRTLALL